MKQFMKSCLLPGLCLGALVFAAPLAAQEAKPLHIEAGFGIPLSAGDGELVPAPGAAFGVYYAAKAGPVGIGLGAWGNLGVLVYDSGNVGVLADVLLGPVCQVFQAGPVTALVAVGGYLNGAQAFNTQVSNMGVGALAGFEWHGGGSWYVSARVQGAVTSGSEWFWSPALCAGLNF